MNNNTEFNASLVQRKKQVKILILGSYTRLNSEGLEESCEEELDAIKDFLKKHGFENTRLVKDWKGEYDVPSGSMDVLFREKSFHYIDKWAEILIFVFLKDTDNFTVIRELGHTVESAKEKCKNSIILRHAKINLHSMMRGDILVARIFEYPFTNKEELYDSAFSGCFNILFTLKRQKST